MTRCSGRAITRRGCVAVLGGAVGAALLAGGLGGRGRAAIAEQGGEQAPEGVDYMVLVNKRCELPQGWDSAIEIVHFTNSEGADVGVEAKAYDAYLELKEDLESDGVYVDLDSAYRSVEQQQQFVDGFIEEYGGQHVGQFVAAPGFSEHHTGLALDLFLVVDGEGVHPDRNIAQQHETWEKIHAKLADHGFILRYPPQKMIVTGYSYEPWHIRYLDDVETARAIMDAGVSLEEYLGEVDPAVAGCEVDYGASELYDDTDIDLALGVVLAEFGTWIGCVMQRIAFTDDGTCAADLDYVNELREARMPELEPFDQAIVLESEFHSPSGEDAEGTAWEPDADYGGWTWHLGRTGADGSWKLLSWGLG